MEASRALNALVAEKVMGKQPGVDFGEWPEHQWKRDEDDEIDMFGYDGDTHNGPSCTHCYYSYCHHCQDGPTEPCEVEPPPYSTDIAAAWQVVDRLRPQMGVAIAVYDDGSARVELSRARLSFEESNIVAIGDTAPLAICRAALA